MDTVTCAYPISPIGSGVSGAWKIVGDDKKHYLVKLAKKGGRAAFNEIFCGCLSRLPGLPSMDPVPVAIGPEPMGQINRVREERGHGPIRFGLHFGVKYIATSLAVKSPDGAGVELTADRATNLDAVPDILSFDTLLQNDDRRCGNTAVEPDASGAGYSHCAFDFGHSFGGPTWNASAIKATCFDSSPIQTFCLIATGMKTPADLERFLQAFDSSLTRWIGEFSVELPPEIGHTMAADMRALREALASLKRNSLVAAIMKAPALLG